MIWSPPKQHAAVRRNGSSCPMLDSLGCGWASVPTWSPSGSKNLLGELKVAHLYSQNNGGFLSDLQIVELATVMRRRSSRGRITWARLRLGSAPI